MHKNVVAQIRKATRRKYSALLTTYTVISGGAGDQNPGITTLESIGE